MILAVVVSPPAQHLNTEHDADVPLVLMNSFNTDTDTEAILRKYVAHCLGASRRWCPLLCGCIS